MRKRTARSLLRLLTLCVGCGAFGCDREPFAARPPLLALTGATLIDGTGADPLSDSTVVIQGDQIVAVGPSSQISVPEDSQVVDVGGRWIMPGMIDTHMHFGESGSLFTRPDIYDLRSVVPHEEEIAWIRQRIPHTLTRYLCSGVTSVVDLGGPEYVYEIRSLSRRLEHSPRVFVAGPFAQNVPVGEFTLWTREDPLLVEVDSAESGRRLVRELAARNVDIVKTGFIPDPSHGLDAYASTLSALVDEAHTHGIPVAVHAKQLEVAKTMLRIGAGLSAHTVEDRPIDEEFLELALSSDTVFASALGVPSGYGRVLGQKVEVLEIERLCGDSVVVDSWGRLAALPDDRTPPIPPRFVNAEATERQMLANFRRMYMAGLVLAVGSDGGNIGSLHGAAFHRELLLMAEAGVAPADVVVAATLNGARALGLEETLGSIEAGKLADLLVLTADPTQSVENFAMIDKVVSRGQVIDRSILLSRPGGPPQ